MTWIINNLNTIIEKEYIDNIYQYININYVNKHYAELSIIIRGSLKLSLSY